MTLKEKIRPSRPKTRSPYGLGTWLMVAAILVAVALLAIRVVDVVSDNQTAPAVPAAETSVSDWTVDDELAAIRSNGRAAQGLAKTPAPEWMLDDELAAIRNHDGAGRAIQTDRPSEPVTKQSGPR
jgi:hypothetical protein